MAPQRVAIDLLTSVMARSKDRETDCQSVIKKPTVGMSRGDFAPHEQENRTWPGHAPAPRVGGAEAVHRTGLRSDLDRGHPERSGRQSRRALSPFRQQGGGA